MIVGDFALHNAPAGFFSDHQQYVFFGAKWMRSNDTLLDYTSQSKRRDHERILGRSIIVFCAMIVPMAAWSKSIVHMKRIGPLTPMCE
jgi:hypothetical protein